jgi:hypothetical protein
MTLTVYCLLEYYFRERKMLTDTRSELIGQLEASQSELAVLLNSLADYQDWQPAPDMWSFRYYAAHLATVDKEAYWERVTRIAAGETPYFDHYLNTDRDFSGDDLLDSLQAWAITRRQIIEFVRSLPEDKLTLTGTHQTFGPITVLDVLQSMLDHDQEHLAELKGYAQRVLK